MYKFNSLRINVNIYINPEWITFLIIRDENICINYYEVTWIPKTSTFLHTTSAAKACLVERRFLTEEEAVNEENPLSYPA
jgi:hypothetical protein